VTASEPFDSQAKYWNENRF